MATTDNVLTTEEFEAQFVQLQSKLQSYLFRLTANRQDAEDLAQETYLKAINNLSGFSGRASLKTWVFTIATNLARDHFRVRHRWRADIQDRCRTATKASPEKVATMHRSVQQSDAARYEFKEHIDFCFTCIAKTLKIEQQLALILKEVYGFRVVDIMVILHLSKGKVKHALADARRTMTEIFDRRCALVNQNGVCYQCSEINGFVNPRQEAREKELSLCRAAELGASKDHLFDLRAELVRGIDPLTAPGATLHAYLLELMPQHADAPSEPDRSPAR